MCLLLETIKIREGAAEHLSWHESRMNRAREELFGITEPAGILHILQVPAAFRNGTVRCNIRYGKEINDISFSHYEKRSIHSLKMVSGDHMDYHFKYADRTSLQELFEQRGNCDEIIIVKNGLVTDTSMSNLIFFDGTNWVTPALPLLEGTCRERLITEGRIVPQNITPDNLPQFRGCKLINAMREPDGEESIPMDRIF